MLNLRDNTEAIRHYNETFSASIERMSESILQVAQGLSRSMELLMQGMKTNQQELRCMIKLVHFILILMIAI